MPKAKYQFEDFLIIIKDEYKSFVTTVHELMLQDGCRPKIEITKSNGFQLAYFQPKVKSVAGRILILYFHHEELTVRIHIENHTKYPKLLNDLPEQAVHQVDKASDCVKFANPEKCWQGCKGYDFYIGEKHYQKCIVNCLQVKIDSESIPVLLELIKSESKARCAS